MLLSMSTLALATAPNDYMFFQTANNAQLSQNADKTYTLTITNPNISYFSNRPTRKAGVMTLTDFVKLWSNPSIKDNFSENPPNVAITVMPETGNSVSLVATVAKPVLASNQLSYQLKMEQPTSFNKMTVKQIDMFFDGIAWNPGGF